MITTLKRLSDGLLRDKDGHIVVWQFPNLPLAGWLLFMFMAYFMPAGWIKQGLGNLSTVCLFGWAYLEIIHGVTNFRRLLGGVVMATILVGFFR